MQKNRPPTIKGKDVLLAGIQEGSTRDAKEYLEHLIEVLKNGKPLSKSARNYLAKCLSGLRENEKDPFRLKNTFRKKKGFPYSESEIAAYLCVKALMNPKKGKPLTLEAALEPAREQLLEDDYELSESTIEKYYKKVNKNPPDYSKPHPFKFNHSPDQS